MVLSDLPTSCPLVSFFFYKKKIISVHVVTDVSLCLWFTVKKKALFTDHNVLQGGSERDFLGFWASKLKYACNHRHHKCFRLDQCRPQSKNFQINNDGPHFSMKEISRAQPGHVPKFNIVSRFTV